MPINCEMDDTYIKILFLLLGWLLGLISPIIVDVIKRRRERVEIRASLKTELTELRYRLACVVHFVEMRFGEANRDLLLWLKPIIESYEGLNQSDNILKLINSQLELSDEQILAVCKHGKAAAEGALNLKKYTIPLLESKYSLLSAYDTSFQNRMFEISTHMSMLNEDVDQARYYFQLTFNEMSDDNHERVVNNLIDSYLSYSNRARIIVNHIGEITW